MPLEIEAKFKISSPGAFRRTLKKNRAVFVSRRFERDIYYSFGGGDFRDTVIRLRSLDKNKGIFTVKFRKGNKNRGKFKVREEIETIIPAPADFEMILRKLHFKEAFRKEKVRETYKLCGAKVLLDKMPYIGWYAEIEGSKDKIVGLTKKLGLVMDKDADKTYNELFEEYKLLTGAKAKNMVFK